MPNSKAGQILFNLQAPAAAIYRVGPAGSGMMFTTIQSAVTQAIADGFTDTTNPSIIEVYPGTYTENVTIGTGMDIKSMGGVTLVGTITYSPGAGAAGTNVSNILDLNITPPAATSAVIIGGTVGGALNLRNTQASPGAAITSNAAGAGSTMFTINNASVAVRIFDYVMTAANVLDPIIFDVQNGTVELYGGRTLVTTSAGTVATGFKVSNSATVNLFCQNAISGAFTQIADIQGAGANFRGFRTNIANTLVGGIMFKFTAAGTCLVRACQLTLADATSKIGSGAAGTINIAACSYAGTIAAPFSAIDTGIAVNQAGTYVAQKSSVVNEFYVGRGVGYGTIQAAITAAAAAAGTLRKVVLIAPGTYNENLTLSPTVDLAADTQGVSTSNTCPVTINGTHTIAFGVANQSININNIRLQSLLTNGTPIIATSGAVTGSAVRLYNCSVFKSFVGAATMFQLTTTGTACGLVLQDCILNLSSDAGGIVFDLSTATNSPTVAVNGQQALQSNPQNCGITIAHQSGGATVQILLVNCPAAGGSFISFLAVAITAATARVFQIATASDGVVMLSSRIQQVLGTGEMFFYAGNGVANICNCFFQQLDDGSVGAKVIGEDGGAGGTFNYGPTGFGFGVVNIRVTLTVNQMTATLTPA